MTDRDTSAEGTDTRTGALRTETNTLRTGTDALRTEIAAALIAARDRTSALTDCVDEPDLIRQHSPLMSPLVWDLAHIANQEEMWLLRTVGGEDPIHPEIGRASCRERVCLLV